MMAWVYDPVLGMIPNIRWLEETTIVYFMMEEARRKARELERRKLRQNTEEKARVRIRIRVQEAVVVGKEGEKEEKRKSMEKVLRELVEGWIQVCKQEGKFVVLEHHEPHVHAVFEPVFDLGTTARFTLRAVNRGHWKLVATIDAELVAPTPTPIQAPALTP